MADSLRFVRLNEDGSVPTSGSVGASDVNITEIAGASVTAAGLPVLAGFSIPPYDCVILTYTDSGKLTLSTAVFKTGGAGGTTVGTVTLTQASTTDTYTKT